MDSEEDDAFSEELASLTLKKEDEDEERESEEEDEEEDARIFNTWMNQYRSTQKKIQGEEEVRERPQNSDGMEPLQQMRVGRRASLPCPATLTAMQLSRLHSTTRAPVTAKVLLRRSSSRRLVPSSQDVSVPALATERRPSLIPPIPEVVAPEKRSHFRRRNVMSLSDADSLCMICHNDLNRGSGGSRELQCSHTFHKECIEEWLWKKQSCPTCQVQVFMPQPLYWSSTRVKVP
ncbi:uncharacterized protein ACB058_003877 isoform 1-T1 [Synchiropus picturatus]